MSPAELYAKQQAIMARTRADALNAILNLTFTDADDMRREVANILADCNASITAQLNAIK